MRCRFPCCLLNGIGYVNFPVPMIQLLPTSSCSCTRVGCLREMICQIAFSACWWWHFFLYATYLFILLATIFNLINVLLYLLSRKLQLHIAYPLRGLIQGHCNLLNRCRQCHFLQLIFMQSLSSRFWRLLTVLFFSFLLFGVVILLAVLCVFGTGIKQTSLQGMECTKASNAVCLPPSQARLIQLLWSKNCILLSGRFWQLPSDSL